VLGASLHLAALIALPGASPFAPGPSTAWAQEGSGGPEADLDGRPPFSEAEVTAFARTVRDLRELGGYWRERLDEAQSDADRRALETAGRVELRQRLRNSALGTAGYRRMEQAVRDDPALRQRIADRLETLPRDAHEPGSGDGGAVESNGSSAGGAGDTP
jgi:hypothetical protein